MLVNTYFTSEKIDTLKAKVLEYFPTTNVNLFNLFFSRLKLILLTMVNVELLYEIPELIDNEFISAVVGVLDRKWLFLLKLQASINASMESLESMNVKTTLSSNINASITSNGTNRDNGTNNSKYSSGYKGFDSVNTDTTFSVDKDDKTYNNTRTFNSTNQETRGLTNEKTKQDLEQYIALFNSTMEDILTTSRSAILSRCCVIFY